MIPEKSESAAPHCARRWSERELGAARALVRRLQQRIVKAAQKRQWRKVQALQYLLTRSAACPQDSRTR